MANITINSTPTRVQYTATSGQTEFTYSFPIKTDTDLKVYQRGASDSPSDSDDLLTITTHYTVSGADTANGGTVTLVTGATTGDIITIVGDKPVDRSAIYNTSSVLKKADLNNDFNDNVMYDKQLETIQTQLCPQYNRSEKIYRDLDNSGNDVRSGNLYLPILNDGYIWLGRGDDGSDPDDVVAVAIGNYDSLGLLSADFIVGTAQAGLSAEQALGDLSSGIMVNSVSGSTGTVLTRTLTGTSNEIDISNGTGVSGNPTIGISDNPTLPGTGSFIWVSGTTAQRTGSPTSGATRWNSTTGEWEGYDGTNWVNFISGDSTGVTQDINQVAHGFTGGEVIRRDAGGSYVKAQADSAANAEAISMVYSVTDVDNFTLITEGIIPSTTGLTGLTDGTVYFLSPSVSGTLTATEPTTSGQISKPVFIATGTDTGVFHNFRGMVVGGSGGGSSVITENQIDTFDFAGETSKDFYNILDGTYNYIDVYFLNVEMSANENIVMEVGYGGTPTYIGGTSYSYSLVVSPNTAAPATTSSTGASGMLITAPIGGVYDYDATTNTRISGKFTIHDPESTNFKYCHSKLNYSITGQANIGCEGTFTVADTNALTSIRIRTTGGVVTFDSGRVVIVGRNL